MRPLLQLVEPLSYFDFIMWDLRWNLVPKYETFAATSGALNFKNLDISNFPTWEGGKWEKSGQEDVPMSYIIGGSDIFSKNTVG